MNFTLYRQINLTHFYISEIKINTGCFHTQFEFFIHLFLILISEAWLIYHAKLLNTVSSYMYRYDEFQLDFSSHKSGMKI